MRSATRAVASVLAAILVRPWVAGYSVLSRIVGPGAALESVSQVLGLLPGFSGNYARRAFYRSVLLRCGRRVCISFGTCFSDPRAEIGENVYVGARCDIGWASIGDDTLLGSGVHIVSGRHTHGFADANMPIRLQPGVPERVTVGADCWIGNCSVVMADVGAHSVVGAGAVVTRPVPEWAVVAGNPARVIRMRTASAATRANQA